MLVLKRLQRMRYVACIVAAVMFMTIIGAGAIGWAEENSDCAEINLGKKITTTNIGSYLTSAQFSAQTLGGREGLMTNMGAGGHFIYVNIGDQFMYDLPENTPVDITIDYYNGSDGKFSISYDSYEPSEAWSGLESNDVWQRTAECVVTNTGEWKSHTFHIENMRAANRCDNWCDFRLALWDPVMGNSPEDILFGAIKIEYGEFLTPVKLSLGTNRTGNIFGADEENRIICDMYNKADVPITVSVSGKICDENGSVISDAEKASFKLGAKEQKTEQINAEIPKKYGLYTFEAITETSYDDKPDEKIIGNELIKLSVSHVFEDGAGSGEFGACHHLVQNSEGVPTSVMDVMTRGGMSYIRDDLRSAASENINGVWTISETKMNKYKEQKARGMKVICIFEGSDTAARRWPVVPGTDEQIADYVKWCRDMASQLKGIVDIYEIWNEPNISTFNPTNVSPEIYAKLVIESSKAIKEVNPDAIILALSTAAMGGLNIDYEFSKRVFDAGAYDYMDVLSIHPYDWSGQFRDTLFIESAEKLHKLMREYGEEKPVWITEFGFSSYIGTGSYTKREQYQNHALGRAISKAYNLYDKYIMYCLADKGDRKEQEHNWGLINAVERPEISPYSAKESYVAMAAFSHFIDADSETKETLNWERTYALRFYNKRLQKDVAYLQTGYGEELRNLRLGCTSAEVYDAYGNKVCDIASDDGVYTFAIEREPCYIVGNFTDFSETETTGAVVPNEISISAVGGDTVSIGFDKMVDKDLNISVSGVDVLENNGFIDGKATVKIKTHDDGSEKLDFFVNISDADGRIYFGKEYTINITPPINVTITAEQAAEINSNYWYARVEVSNLSTENAVSGQIEIAKPERIAQINGVRRFDNIAPQGKITFLYQIPEKVNKNVIDLTASAKLDNGYEGEYTSQLNFTNAVYAKNKPVIDGVINPGEWGGSWICADEAKDLRNIKGWDGPADLSFSGTMMWDEENFYFTGIATDDVYFTQFKGGIGNMWSVDSFQIGFDDRINLNPVEKGKFTEIGLGEAPGIGAAINRTMSLYDLPTGQVTNAEIAVKRYNTYTVYECRIPWSEIFYEGYELNPDASFKISIMLNENDGNGRGWIEYCSGIGARKDAQLFGDLKFLK